MNKYSITFNDKGLKDLDYAATCLEISRLDTVGKALGLLTACLRAIVKGEKMLIQKTDGSFDQIHLR